MEFFNILYIEHDPMDSISYKQAMMSASSSTVSVRVESLPSPEGGSLRKRISANRFDLIVTDANFLSEGLSPLDNGEGEYLLDTIITEIREVDKRVKIAVLSEFSSRFLSDPERGYDLEKVDYLWDKGKDDFIRWQVSRIITEVSRTYPENSIINKLLQLPDSNPSMPWKGEIVGMASKYKRLYGEREQVNAIFEDLKMIASYLGFSSAFSSAYNILMESEQINVAGKPKAWGHLRHALNVFWLGYYLLNNGVFDKEFFAEKLFKDRGRSKDVDACWFLASIFHDIGKVGETSDDIVKNFNEVLVKFPGNPVQLGVTTKKIDNEIINDALTEIQSLSGVEVGKVLDKIKNTPLVFDHGVLSAIYVHVNFRGNNDVVNKAVTAIAFHNFIEDAKGISTPKFSFDAHPILALLTLCDQIEVWERETGLASLYSKIPIESTELLAITEEGVKNIVFTVHYLPFRYILPQSPHMATIQRDLGTIITEKVIPALDKIDMGTTGSSVGVHFKLDGRTTLDAWPSKLLQS